MLSIIPLTPADCHNSICPHCHPCRYSLAIFIPVGFLCAIPFTWLQWLVILLAFCSTAWFLARNFNSHITQAAAQAQAMLQGRLSEKALRALITLMGEAGGHA